MLSLILDRMYQSSCVFTSSIGYVGGPGSGTSMLVVGLLVLAEWRAPNGSIMALKLQHDRFQSAGACWQSQIVLWAASTL